MEISIIDWFIIILYIIGMITMSAYLAKGQKNEKDYYLGGNKIGAWPIAISTMATQCSTTSLLGAPAFVAFAAGGGLIWLQYELAVPFAMIVLIIFVLPVFRRLKLISVYNYLEMRFGIKTRTLVSILFQTLRAFAAGVIVYGIAIVLSLTLKISFATAALGLGIVTIIYDMLGGMKAVVYSDVIQMIILYGAIFFACFFSINLIGGWEELLHYTPMNRIQTVDLSAHGFGDGKTFAFLPMLVGGLFLYLAYYGTDQTQVQRELSTKSIDDTNSSLFINGLLRFPLVLTYCLLGVCLAAFASKYPEFIDLIPTMEVIKNGQTVLQPNYNLAVPVFVLKYFPVGLVGLVFVGLFSAAMSSLDSTINSLSATSMRDILQRFWPHSKYAKNELITSKLLTLFWGVVCVGFSFFVDNISSNIIVAINKIGSVSNGPILGVFLLGIFTKRTNEFGALIGLAAGVITNLVLWVGFPEVSWLWWNVTGFIITFVFGFLASPRKPANKSDDLYWSEQLISPPLVRINWYKRSAILACYGLVIFVLLLSIQSFS